MGQHTWFLKSKELYLKQNELYEKLDKFENGEIYLDDLELLQLNTEIDEIDEQNDADDYHDLFRTGKCNENKTYTDDVLFSRKECFEWIDKPENFVSFKNTIFETDEQEKINREYSINKLNEFWGKYPDGVIYFG